MSNRKRDPEYVSKVAQWIKGGLDMENKNNVGRSLLHEAVMNNQVDVVEYLLSVGADVNSRDIFQRTPLHSASSLRCLELVVFLLDKGADISSTDDDGKTATLIAAAWDELHVLKYFLDRGEDMETNNAHKTTALSVAVLGSALKTNRELVDRGAFIETRDEDDCTPLSVSVDRGDPELIKYLLFRGADSLSVSSSDKAVIAYASHRPPVVNLLLEHGRRLPPGNISDMDKCLARGVENTIAMYEYSFLTDFNAKYTMVKAFTVDDLYREIASVAPCKMKVVIPIYVRRSGLQATGVGGHAAVVMAYRLNPTSRIHVWYHNPWGEARNLEYFERAGREDPLTQIRDVFADKGGPQTVVHLFTNERMGLQRKDAFKGIHECATECIEKSKFGDGCCVSWTRMYAYTISNRSVSGMEDSDVEYVIEKHDTHLHQNADILFARGEITLRHYLEAKRLPIHMFRELIGRLDLMDMGSLERVTSATGKVRSADTLENAMKAFRDSGIHSPKERPFVHCGRNRRSASGVGGTPRRRSKRLPTRCLSRWIVC